MIHVLRCFIVGLLVLVFSLYNIAAGLSHSNHMTSSKAVDILICHSTMCRDPLHFSYNPGHVII